MAFSAKSISSLLAGFGAACLCAFPSVAGPDAKEGEKKPYWVLGGFAGVTETKYGEQETVGLEAFYRANRRVSVGGVVEHLPDYGDGHEANLALLVVGVHATDNIRLLGGAGREYHHGHEQGVWRLGVAYDFHFGKYHIGPLVNVDFYENHENTIYGIAFARSFGY